MERPTATSLAQQYGAHIMGKTIMITGVSPGSIAGEETPSNKMSMSSLRSAFKDTTP